MITIPSMKTVKRCHLEPFAIYNNVQVLDSVEELGKDLCEEFSMMLQVRFSKGDDSMPSGKAQLIGCLL